MGRSLAVMVANTSSCQTVSLDGLYHEAAFWIWDAVRGKISTEYSECTEAAALLPLAVFRF